jgi:hypothetical protein
MMAMSVWTVLLSVQQLTYRQAAKALALPGGWSICVHAGSDQMDHRLIAGIVTLPGVAEHLQVTHEHT